MADFGSKVGKDEEQAKKIRQFEGLSEEVVRMPKSLIGSMAEKTINNLERIVESFRNVKKEKKQETPEILGPMKGRGL